MCRRKPNRKYSFESMRARIQSASSEAEIESLSNLLDNLGAADMLTVYQYRELNHMLDVRMCQLMKEGKF